MRSLLKISGLTFLLACNGNSNSTIQQFPSYKIALECPCTLVRDEAREKKLEEDINSSFVAYSCQDLENGDTYRLNILLGIENKYSNEQIMNAVDSTLDAGNVTHTRINVAGYEGIAVTYPNVKVLELFGKEFSYSVILEAKDSLDAKFEALIRSISSN